MNTIKRLLKHPDGEMVCIYGSIFVGAVAFWSAVSVGLTLIVI